MAKGTREYYIDHETFKLGLYALEDTTKAPFGTARTMRNMQVTDAGGIAPRPGTQVLGTLNTTGSPIRGLYSYRRSFSTNEILIKAYDDELEGYSLNHADKGWFRIKNGFTADKEFGFVTSLVNKQNQDYVIFCNRYDEYQRWTGEIAILDGELSGGETTITVDSTLTDEIYESKTATSNAATTLNVSGTPWAASQWIGFFVHITSGALSGYVREITANTTSQITFDTLGSAPGNCTFQIRRLKFPETGTISYTGYDLYTDMVSYWQLGEASGTRADSRGINHLSDINTVTNAAGIQGNAADFESSNSEYLSIDHVSQIGLNFSNAFSFSCWINLESAPGIGQRRTIISKFGDDPNNSYMLQLRQNAIFAALSTDGSTTSWTNSTSWSPSTGVWYHLVLTYDGITNTVNLYKDGTLLDSEVGGTVPSSIYEGEGPFQIGNLAADGTSFDGLIDEVAAFSRALTAEEVAWLYNSGTGKTYAQTSGAAGTSSLAYTGIPTSTTITVASAYAAPDGAVISLAPTVYSANPRGNRLANYLNRMVVANVRSALAYNSGNALSGFSAAGSYFYSKTNDPFDFTFTATRVAGEGGIESAPYGGFDFTDVVVQEDTVYAFKPRYIESVSFSQDANDLPIRVPLKSEIGSVGQTIKGSDDIYFITDDKQFTSLGRVESKDVTPQTQNIGYKIKRLLDSYEFGVGRGKEYKNKIYIPARSDSVTETNDIVIVYSKANDAFEGIWDISANYIETFNKKLYAGDSVGSNVFELLTGTADVIGNDRFPISAAYATHFMNFASTKGNLQAMNALYFEGYISGDTAITFKSWKDFAYDPFLEFTFTGGEEGLLDGTELSASLGSSSLGLQPIGSISTPDADGRRHFYFRVYFPFQYGNHFSVGFENSSLDDIYEITRMGLGLKETVSTDANRVKSI